MAKRSENEDMVEPYDKNNKLKGIIGLVQKRSGTRIRGRLVGDRPLCISINPADSVPLRSRQMEIWNGGTSSKLCLQPFFLKNVGSRCQPQARKWGGLCKKLMLMGKP